VAERIAIRLGLLTPAGVNPGGARQTGSGKTHTMSAVYAQAAAGVLAGADVKGLHVLISFFEIYGGR
jgi:hypothetical protein